VRHTFRFFGAISGAASTATAAPASAFAAFVTLRMRGRRRRRSNRTGGRFGSGSIGARRFLPRRPRLGAALVAPALGVLAIARTVPLA
jgi:hypothetical protein